MITCTPPKDNVCDLLFHKDTTADWAIAPAGKDTGKYFVYTKAGPEKVRVFLTMEGGKVFGRAYPSNKKSLFNFGDDDEKEPEDGKDPKEEPPKKDPKEKEPPKKDPKGKEPKKGKEPPKDGPPEKDPKKPKDPKGPSKDSPIKSSIWEITEGTPEKFSRFF